MSCGALLGALASACSGPVDSLSFDDDDASRSEERPEDVRTLEQPVIDGKFNTTPTAWTWMHGQSAEQLTAYLQANNMRLVSLQVETASPLRFTVALVENAGSHTMSWTWVHSKNETELRALIRSQSLRIVDLEAYQVDGITRFAAILVSNTGANAKRWWWTHQATPNEIGVMMEQARARPIDLDRYVYNNQWRYAAVMIDNTGSDGKAWWWYFGMTGRQVADTLRQNRAQLTGFEFNSAGTYDVLMEPSDGTTWWWWYDQVATQVDEKAALTGSRVVEIKKIGPGGFVAIFANNSDQETTRIGNILRESDGVPGFMVKRVGGAVGANLQREFPFDPASSIKTLIGVHALRQMESSGGSLSLASEINTYRGSFFDCPQSTLSGRETMGNALREMLVRSDNHRTLAFMTRFGNGAIEATAQALGLSSVQLRNFPGCQPFSNRWTLTDALRLYEGISNRTALNATSRTELFARMPRAEEDVGGVVAKVHRMIDEEALAAGVCTGRANQFKNMFRAYYKEGHHWVIQHNRSIAGIAQIPACSGSAMVTEDHVWGVFLYNARVAWESSYDRAQVEPLRVPIRERLLKWSSCTAASLCTP